MSDIQAKIDFFVSTPKAISLGKAESFVIDSVRYVVEPDVTCKVRGGVDGKFFFLQSKGFAGREFVIVTDDGRRIVTHNLWMGEGTDEPDTARFEGTAAKPVSLAGRHRFGPGGA